MSRLSDKPQVGILMGSDSDWSTMKAAAEALKEFGIPGNDVQRWTKDWDKLHDFLKPEEYRLLAISMLSTHDTSL